MTILTEVFINKSKFQKMMKTKYKQTSELISKRHTMIEMFFEYAQLKNLYRQGWLKCGITTLHCETVADHSFGVALLGYTIAEEYRPDLDSTKVMKLGLFHEMGEIYAGDVTPVDNVSIDEKVQKEFESVQKVFSKLPDSDKYINIWLEFEYQKSAEAKFVKQIDKLELVLQADLYEKLDYKELDEFFSSVKKKIETPELKTILNDILNSR